jgi:hypothetical protein
VHAPLEATNRACSSALVSLHRGVSAQLPGTQSVRPSSVPSPPSSTLSWSRPVHAAAKAPSATEEKTETQAEGNGREALGFKEGSAPAFIKDDSSTRFREDVRKAYEEDMAGRPLWGAATGRPALQHACRKTVGLAAAMGLHMQQCMRISTHSIRLGKLLQKSSSMCQRE